jgi:hypothetical protein
MSANPPKLTDFPRRAIRSFREETGQSLALWAFIALTSFVTQIVLRRELLPGEFGTVNTALGVIGLMMVPLLAVNQAFTWHLTRLHGPGQQERLDNLRAAALLVTETFAWAWGAIAGLLLLFVLPLLDLPRFSISLFTLLNVLIALGGLLSGIMCQNTGQVRLWVWLLVSSALARLFLAGGFVASQPWAESGLAAFLIAGLITFAPALRPTEAEPSQRLKALRTALDRVFLLDLGATFSVVLAFFLFSSADRIVAQSWFGTATDNNIGYVDWAMFDAYQTAGLLGRSILWGTQPLLLMLLVRRSRLNKTTSASLDWFWIYLGALVSGVTFLELFHQPLSMLFCGRDYLPTSHLVPVFAASMIPLGLLQGLGMFALASRRYPECFVLGACSIGYTLLLYLAGRQPQLMPAYMFGGGLVALMIVLFVGVVRWGRKQP